MNREIAIHINESVANSVHENLASSSSLASDLSTTVTGQGGRVISPLRVVKGQQVNSVNDVQLQETRNSGIRNETLILDLMLTSRASIVQKYVINVALPLQLILTSRRSRFDSCMACGGAVEGCPGPEFTSAKSCLLRTFAQDDRFTLCYSSRYLLTIIET